jgi:uncharacterized membrane protein YraQ (UPF0718 family)
MRVEHKINGVDTAANHGAWVSAVFIPVSFVVGLLAYKWHAALVTIQRVWLSGAISTPSDIVAFDQAGGFAAAARTLHYFGVIWPALAFGILIGAAVRAFVPPEWLAGLFRGKLRAQFAAGAAGAPLMLCSCCVAPVFSAMYERSSRLGPAVAMMIASPSLNPAAIVLTFTLFAPNIAAMRLAMAAMAVLLSGVVTEQLAGGLAPGVVRSKQTGYRTPVGLREAPAALLRSLAEILVRTIPALVLGVICSMVLIQYVPKELLASNVFRSLAVVTTASIAVPLALPTFFEIPLALGLLAAGAPIGAAAALLFAGPAINLPSLLTLAKSADWRVAAVLAFFIWAVAIAGGLLLNAV